jgi:hypothetical protein
MRDGRSTSGALTRQSNSLLTWVSIVSLTKLLPTFWLLLQIPENINLVLGLKAKFHTQLMSLQGCGIMAKAREEVMGRNFYQWCDHQWYFFIAWSWIYKAGGQGLLDTLNIEKWGERQLILGLQPSLQLEREIKLLSKLVLQTFMFILFFTFLLCGYLIFYLILPSHRSQSWVTPIPEPITWSSHMISHVLDCALLWT